MRREAEDEARWREPGIPSALGSGGSGLGRADPLRQAHPHPERERTSACAPPGRPGLVAGATSCWWPGLGRVPAPPLGPGVCLLLVPCPSLGGAGMQAGSRPLSISSSPRAFHAASHRSDTEFSPSGS